MQKKNKFFIYVAFFALSSWFAGGGGIALAGVFFSGQVVPTFNDPTTGIFDVQNGNNNVPLSIIRVGTAEVGSFPNELAISGEDFAINLHEPFKLANMLYFNGRTLSDGSTPPTISLSIKTNLDSPLSSSFASFDFLFGLEVTTNVVGDPLASADRLRVLSTTPNSSIFFNGAEYQLRVLGFSDSNSSSDINTVFTLFEDTASFTNLWGEFVQISGFSIVPEPSSALLLSLASFGLFSSRKRPHKVH